MAISDKLNYLIETKSQLKDMINYGLPTENQITNETTFRNYVKGIFEAFIESLRDSTTLYTNLPKISGNGTQITLNDTANAPMRITLKASELSQDATPTPDTPQDIHTISGDNTIVVEGKNIFDIDTFKNLSTFNTYETHNNIECLKLVGRTITYNLNCKDNTQYTFQFKYIDKTSADVGNFQFLYSDGTVSNIIYSGHMTTSGTIYSATSKANKTVTGIKWDAWNAGNSIYIDKNSMQIESGSTATTYEPYVSQIAPINLDTIEYCKIGNYEDEFILTSGKNLFDKSTVTENRYINNTGTLVTDNNFYASDYIDVSNYSSIVFNGNTIVEANWGAKGAFYDTNKTFVSYVDIAKTANVYSIPNNAKYYRTSIRKENIDSIMLNEGTTALPYEPYGTNQWYLKKNIGKVVLDGSESWDNFQIESSGLGRAIVSSSNVYYESNQNTIMASNMVGVRYSGSWNNTYDCIASYASNRFIAYLENASDLATFKSILNNSNAIVYYVLSTPTYTQITGTLETQLNNIYENMLSYKGTTNISQVNNDLPFVLGVSAIQDLE